MTAIQIVPMAEARPGDRVREAGPEVAFENMPKVVHTHAEGLVICDNDGQERLVSPAQIVRIVRSVSLGPMQVGLPLVKTFPVHAPDQKTAEILAKFLQAAEELRTAGAPAAEIAVAESLARAAARALGR